ncbi:MAG: DUF5309 family protein [Planctomycetes bacterium]|nr:DUF5309 family protein [Planctomycetota bacterium]MCW8135604.1 DUF5309 family protein [Planctomycetota bacterium]
MSFTGKATYDAGSTLPELVDDVSDLVGLISPFDTPLLDAIGSPRYAAQSTRHEWFEDRLNPNFTAVNNEGGYNNSATSIVVDDGGVFRAGDIVKPQGSDEVLQVTGISTHTLTVARGYGGSTAAALADNQPLTVIGHAALEGEDAAAARHRNRLRRENYTQIFTETVMISGSMDAVGLHAVEREFDYQVIQRLRELLRSLEQTVICGFKAADNPQGSASVRRTMGGLLQFIAGSDAAITDADNEALDEPMLNAALRECWEKGGRPNAIVCNGLQKRAISSFIQSSRRYEPESTALRHLVDTYESDFGVQRVILSRWVPADKVLLLDLDKLQVLPLQGRSFFVKPLAESGDFRKAQIIGEYTLEILNGPDGGHGLITGLATE